MRRLVKSLRKRWRRRFGRPSPKALWVRQVRECQQILAESDPNPHYLTAYRQHEMSYWEHIARWIHELRGTGRVERCLDIGCAYGTLALFCRRVLGCEVYCTDFTDSFFTQSVGREYGLVFARNNIESDPFAWAQRFDLIIFTEVLEHLNLHPVPTLTKIRELLTERGRVYLSTPDASEWGRVTKYYESYADMPYERGSVPLIDDHVYHYSKGELAELFAAAGLAIERLAYAPGAGWRHFNLALRRQA